MRKIIKFSLPALFLVILYLIAWYVLTNNLAKFLNSHSSSLEITILNQTVNLNFKEARPYGFPFKIACRIFELKENSPLSSAMHNGNIIIGYDIIKRGVFFSNAGESIVKAKPEASGFGSKIDINTLYFAKINILSALYRYITKGLKAFELINFVENIHIETSNGKAWDLVSSELIFDHDFVKFDVNWDKSEYYTSFDELRKNIPKDYSIQSAAIINYSLDEKKMLAPLSLIYLSLPQANKSSMELVANVSTNKEQSSFDDLLQNFVVKISKLDVQGEEVRGSFIGNVDVKTTDGIEEGNFDFDTNLNFSSLKQISNYIEELSKKIPKAAMLKNEYLFKLLDQPCVFKSAANGGYKIYNNERKSLDIKNLQMIIGDVGITLKLNTARNTSNQWHFDGTLLLSKIDKAVAQLVQLVSTYGESNPYEQQRLMKTILLLLKGISSYPKSQNDQDITIDFMLSNDINSSKIGNIPLRFFMNNEKFKNLFKKGN